MPSELDIEITTTESFLAEFKVRPGRRTVDHALARYLWCGVQTAEVINLACQAGHPAGERQPPSHFHRSELRAQLPRVLGSPQH